MKRKIALEMAKVSHIKTGKVGREELRALVEAGVSWGYFTKYLKERGL